MTGGALTTKRVAKPWGRLELPPPFVSNADERIGEIWFEPPPQFDALLAKYLFTSDKLSVQVHPSDEDAGDDCGKEECWLILDAKPGARLAAGFRAPISPEEMRSAALDGSIGDMLAWHEVSSGDFIYIPAGTVHAIGPGISLVEIQQNCDTTYRLFDYGRPRNLHLDEAIAVARGEPHPPEFRRSIDPRASEILIDGPYFRVAHCFGVPGREITDSFTQECLIMPLDGHAIVSDAHLAAGDAGWMTDIEKSTFSAEGRFLIASPVNHRN